LKKGPDKKKKSVNIHLNPEWCKGCYICFEACPKKVFEKSPEVSEKGYQPVVVAHPECCSRCLQCEMLCPDLAINIEKEE
jgi:2-oxoglutarate ferredoxin oxidoreductase subunit delta